jgi:hypothetical protein
MPQADAFETAAEHAVFLGAYQMYYGPYGSMQDPAERQKLLRETAQAIDDCVNGRACGSDKQEKVLKALVQYNAGRELQHMMLTNSTNRERMRSMEYRERGYGGQPLLDPAGIQRSLASGKDHGKPYADPTARRVTDETRRFRNSGGTSRISRSHGTAKDPYFQLNEAEVKGKIDPSYLRERELMGDKFLEDYGKLIDYYSRARREGHYRFIPAGETHVFDGLGNQRRLANPDRFAELQREQQSPGVQSALEAHRRSLGTISGGLTDDGQVHIIGDGFDPRKLGIGEMQSAEGTGVKVDDLRKDGKLEGLGNARAITRVVNQRIKEVAEKKIRPASGAARSPGSAPPTNTYVNVTLSPEGFGKFLDEIWPPSAARR